MSRRWLLIIALLLGAAALWVWAARPQPRMMALSFTSHTASPAVLTGFAIEQKLDSVFPLIAAGLADLEMPRSNGGYLLTRPHDVGRDGIWTIRAEWVELPTDRAWRAEADVAIRDLDAGSGAYELTVIFGPNGELQIASDPLPDPDTGAHLSRDVARVCGKRAPAADRRWRSETGIFPEITHTLAFARDNAVRVTAPPFCPPALH